MIVKFFRRSKEMGSAPFNYFLGVKRDRENARVISGDPVITEHLINATKYHHKYKSGVLSFTERSNELTEQQKTDIMQEFEKTLFPGLEPDQYDITWIEHSDKDIDENNPVGRLELNFVIPCQELRTGARLQPFYSATDLKRVNAWKDLINHNIKTVDGKLLANPNEPQRKRLLNPYLGTAPKPTPYNRQPKKVHKSDLDTSSRDGLRESIEQHLLAQHERRQLVDRRAVINELDMLGIIIERTVKKTITVSHPKLIDKNGEPLRVRLIGAMYSEDFSPKDYKPAAQAQYERDSVRRKLRAEYIYKTGMEIKTEQNRELYGKTIAPLPFALDIKLITVAFTEKTLLETPQQSQPQANSSKAILRKRS